jgi:hypothetical protein
LTGLAGEKSLGFEMGLSEIEGEMMSALHREDAEKRPPPESSDERRARVTGFSIQLPPTPECLRRFGMTRTGWPTLNPASVGLGPSSLLRTGCADIALEWTT